MAASPQYSMNISILWRTLGMPWKQRNNIPPRNLNLAWRRHMNLWDWLRWCLKWHCHRPIIKEFLHIDFTPVLIPIGKMAARWINALCKCNVIYICQVRDKRKLVLVFSIDILYLTLSTFSISKMIFCLFGSTCNIDT